MKQIFVFLGLFFLLSNAACIDYNNLIKSSNLYLLDDDLQEVISYYNYKKFFIYKKTEVEPNKYKIQTIEKLGAPVEYTREIVKSKNLIEMLSYSKERVLLYKRMFYIVNNRIKEIKTQEYFRPEEKDEVRIIKNTWNYEYDKKGRLIKQYIEGGLNKEVFYKEDRIDYIVYHRNGKKFIDKYRYKNKTNYECSPSYEYSLSNLTGSESMDEKVHYERYLDYGDKEIIEEFYNNGKLKIGRLVIIRKNKLLFEMDYYDARMKDLNTTIYIYKNLNNPYKDLTDIIKEYRVNIDNLRFRGTEGLSGKFIRYFNKGEKLYVLRKGNTENINTTKGTWVLVRTDKGEIGWCFDAYLDEVK